jgi:hypothetical protein
MVCGGFELMKDEEVALSHRKGREGKARAKALSCGKAKATGESCR